MDSVGSSLVKFFAHVAFVAGMRSLGLLFALCNVLHILNQGKGLCSRRLIICHFWGLYSKMPPTDIQCHTKTSSYHRKKKLLPFHGFITAHLWNPHLLHTWRFSVQLPTRRPFLGNEPCCRHLQVQLPRFCREQSQLKRRGSIRGAYLLFWCMCNLWVIEVHFYHRSWPYYLIYAQGTLRKCPFLITILKGICNNQRALTLTISLFETLDATLISPSSCLMLLKFYQPRGFQLSVRTLQFLAGYCEIDDSSAVSLL